MTQSSTGLQLGKRIAPPRFILFVLLFAAGLGIGIPMLGWGRGTLAAFDVASAVFLLSLTPLLRRGQADQIRQTANANDANRVLLLAITGLTMLVILVAVSAELKGQNDAGAIALVIVTLALAWLFSNVVYALHYAHLYYGDGDDDGEDDRGLDFPKCDEPDYWDFIYFSFTLGMTFQTSDVEMTAQAMRRVAIGHCLAAFVFNLGVLAFTINVLGGG